MIGGPPICLLCTRLSWNKNTPICPAFPNGIPDEIFVAGFDHRKPFKGDQGIRFELQAGKEAELTRWEKHRIGP